MDNTIDSYEQSLQQFRKSILAHSKSAAETIRRVGLIRTRLNAQRDRLSHAPERDRRLTEVWRGWNKHP